MSHQPPGSTSPLMAEVGWGCRLARIEVKPREVLQANGNQPTVPPGLAPSVAANSSCE